METIFTANAFVALGITVAAGLATVLGSFLVIFAKQTNTRLLAFGLAFAAGAMVYVSLVEIFVKSQIAFEAAYDPKTAYGYATLFFFVGVALLVAIDRMVPNPHATMDPKGIEEAADSQGHPDHHGHPHAAPLSLTNRSMQASDAMIRRVGLMAALAITAHNLPEGLATFFATLESPTIGLPLALAIAIHNIPEGVSIAVPIYYATGSKQKAVVASLLSGLAEPVGAIVGYLILAPFLTDFVFGAVFGVIAGVMVFLALDELLPAARHYAKGHETVYGMVIGMAALAVSLVLFK
jgi:ZIP family zinc transporter